MAEVADRLGWSESTVSRLETGRRNLAAEDVATLLAIYEITGSERDQLIAMAKTVDEPGWWETTLRGLPSNFVTLAKYEAEARRIANWAPLLMPGLVQTMDYTRAYMLADGIAEQDIGARLMGRQRRQDVLDRVEYTAYIAENVLRQQVGGRVTLINQLRHLLQVSEQPNVTIRVVPVKVDAHSGLIGPFLMMEFEDTPPAVLVELRRSAVFLNGQADTYPYTESLDHLSSLSLDAQESRRCIADVISDLGSETR
jgi:transcriptional regulator with XRE-family HTH domain